MLVVGLVQLVTFDATKVLPHVELFVVGNGAIEPSIVEYTAFF
jgi:hypothetical protein